MYKRQILDIKDINIGLNAKNVTFMTTPVEGVCERCGRKTWLDHVWEHDGKEILICPACAAELKEKLGDD